MRCSKCGAMRDGRHESWCKKCLREHARSHYVPKPHRPRIYTKAQKDARYKERHRAELAAKQRDYYQRHHAESDARNAAYLAVRPHLRRALRFANRSNQRAAEVGADGKLYARDIVFIDGPCAYCGGEASGWDHRVPLSRGGANEVANIVRCCIDCNRRKADRTPEEWRAA